MSLESCVKGGGRRGKRLGLRKERNTMSQRGENLAH